MILALRAMGWVVLLMGLALMSGWWTGVFRERAPSEWLTRLLGFPVPYDLVLGLIFLAEWGATGGAISLSLGSLFIGMALYPVGVGTGYADVGRCTVLLADGQVRSATPGVQASLSRWRLFGAALCARASQTPLLRRWVKPTVQPPAAAAVPPPIPDDAKDFL